MKEGLFLKKTKKASRAAPLAAALLAAMMLFCLAGCQKSEVVGGGAASAPDLSDPVPSPEPTAAPEPNTEPEPDTGPDAPDPEAEELLAIFGEWSEQGIYTNTVLGLQYVLPEGWIPISQEETLAVANILTRDGLMDKRALERIRSMPDVLLMAARDSATGDNALILYDAREDAQLTKEEYAERSGRTLEQAGGEFGHVVGESYLIEAGGIEFIALPVDTSLGNTHSRQLSYICELDGHILDIIVTAMSDIPPDELAGGIAAFSFE